MDIIDSANMQRIIDFLKPQEGCTFQARKHKTHWFLSVQESDGTVKYQVSASTFSDAVKNLSRLIYNLNKDSKND